MPSIVYDLVNPTDLVNYARAFDNEVLKNRFTLETFLPNRLVDDLEYRIRQGTLQDVEAAQFRAWDTPAPMTGRPGVTRIRGELIPVSRQIPLGEEEFLRLRQLQQKSDEPVINAVYDDVERMIRAVQARVEMARGQLLSTGKVTLNENGLQIEADFGLAGTHNVTAGTVWTNTAAATPLTNLLAWQDTYITDTGTAPSTVLMSQTQLSNLYLNAEMRAAAAANGTTPARINRDFVDAIFAANGLPPISTYDVMVRTSAGQVRVWPTDKIAFLPDSSEPIGNTFYGITAEAIKLAGKGYIEGRDMPGVVAIVTETDHPVQTFTVGTAIALPVLPNPSLLFVADVA